MMHTFGNRSCDCGSGLPRYDLNDTRGIFCGYVCAKCEKAKAAQFRPEIFSNPDYDHDEPIDE
jgi:hypothetical protein